MLVGLKHKLCQNGLQLRRTYDIDLTQKYKSHFRLCHNKRKMELVPWGCVSPPCCFCSTTQQCRSAIQSACCHNLPFSSWFMLLNYGHEMLFCFFCRTLWSHFMFFKQLCGVVVNTFTRDTQLETRRRHGLNLRGHQLVHGPKPGWVASSGEHLV